MKDGKTIIPCAFFMMIATYL